MIRLLLLLSTTICSLPVSCQAPCPSGPNALPAVSTQLGPCGSTHCTAPQPWHYRPASRDVVPMALLMLHAVPAGMPHQAACCKYGPSHAACLTFLR